MRYLTKSRFSLALECPTKLTYSDNAGYANADATNEFLLALADGGHQVGALAKCLFPGGIEIDAIGHDAQVTQTEASLAEADVTLFEAAIRVGRLFIRTDLLSKSGTRLDLYEVKAKGIDPENPEIVGKRGGFLAGMRPYLYDVAFQRYVLRKAFPEAEIHSHLVMPNKTAICGEPRLAQRLTIHKADGRVRITTDPSLSDGALARVVLHILPVDEYLDQLEALPLNLGGWAFGFSEGIEALAERLDVDPFPPRLGSYCKVCQFHASAAERAEGKRDGRMECLQQAAGLTPEAAAVGTVLELYQSRAVDKLITDGKVLLVDLESEDVKLAEQADEVTLSHRQWLQSEEARGALPGPVVRSQALKAQLEALNYPLHFIDFETSRPSLPFHADRGPYDQLLFQFSHHRLETDGALQHATQHLSERLDELPNFDTVQALKAALGSDHGAVLHWWDHERTVLKEVKGQLLALPEGVPTDRADLLAFLDELLGTDSTPGRLFDLGRLIHRSIFFPGTGGSSSLKKVLPALLATSSGLREKYAAPIYGHAANIPSLNFAQQAWVKFDESGRVIDPYSLLGQRVNDEDMTDLERLEDDGPVVADGGAAMVAYALLQNGQLADSEMQELRTQLLRYCELDTFAMVLAWEGIQELVASAD